MYPILIIGGVILSAAALYHGIVIREYSVKSDRIGSLKIALISDLHNAKHNKLIEITREAKPDLIALAGDIVDTRYPMKYVNKFLDEIVTVGCPVFYVTGNHETGALGTKKLKNEIGKRGITVLDDKYIKIKINGNDLLIAGIDDPYRRNTDRWKKEIKPLFSDIKNENCYRLMIAHRPDLWEIYRDLGFDLVLSGHAHGGQVRIPYLINGLYAPHQGFLPKYAGGLYDHGGMYQIVSRGLSKFINLPRVFNPPELVIINFNRSTS